MRKKRSELVTIWRSVANIPGWLRSLWRTKQYSEDELNELERIDDEFRAFSREEEIKHRKWLRKNLPRTTEGWLKVFPEAKKLIPRKKRKNQRRFEEMLDVARDVDLEDVVSEYVDLRQSGAYRMVGSCPFHDDKTPSFFVYTTDNHYYCFGCHEHGDVITFVRKIKNLKFKMAVRILYRYSQQD